MRKILVIGGSRYFGRHLVELLRDAGDRVTVLNRGASAPPAGVGHIAADRSDGPALAAALGGRTFDTVVDQVLYTPADAATARDVFAGRTARYVATSTMEVYDPATAPALSGARLRPSGAALRGIPEDAVDPREWPVDADLWRDPARAAAAYDEATHYAEGKRQAEAVLAAQAEFAFASVRSAHVAGGGARDFTGRLAHYVDRIADGRPVAVHAAPQPTSFIGHTEIARVLAWAAGADFTGPVNAASRTALSALDLSARIGAHLGREPRFAVVGTPDGADPGTPGGAGPAEASPYSFDRFYAMDNHLAGRLGFTFSDVSDWLPGAIDDALRTRRAGKDA
ncbi:NAD-dependent epimerase/dehydratase family protein [Yinghuangia soli]|uniref:NAD-dependent epimerase/dehydratase family protein n=1 Tax=Yinghuangia soli TaxID=2908204 RepID=A0AA41Q0Q6_9ACTN|nr:NAD-dependent epimerase/dehydratase family protein [Yinghuangia soli]MCF2527922.1 NAD-dependent epimerase/dehydratase family protein [Yinghuangia soli]